MGGKCSETQSLAAHEEQGQTNPLGKRFAPFMEKANPGSLNDAKPRIIDNADGNTGLLLSTDNCHDSGRSDFRRRGTLMRKLGITLIIVLVVLIVLVAVVPQFINVNRYRGRIQ